MNEEVINQLKEIINKYPDKKQEILLYIFGRDNLVKMINEPTYEQLQQENQQLQQRIDKAIEILKLCNSQCAKETIEILKGTNQ